MFAIATGVLLVQHASVPGAVDVGTHPAKMPFEHPDRQPNAHTFAPGETDIRMDGESPDGLECRVHERFQTKETKRDLGASVRRPASGCLTLVVGSDNGPIRVGTRWLDLRADQAAEGAARGVISGSPVSPVVGITPNGVTRIIMAASFPRGIAAFEPSGGIPSASSEHSDKRDDGRVAPAPSPAPAPGACVARVRRTGTVGR